jgi:triacylglycerol lipase
VRRAVEASRRARAPHCLTGDCGCSFTIDYGAPFPRDRVRMTSIYTRGDGVVRWQCCLAPYADCVEVPGSHTGLILNHHAYRAIARALAEPELT